jgi:uncharacterized linocin/CFP29 family protein
MSEKFLHRGDAPLGDAVWSAIDHAVIETAKSQLCGRRLMKTQGPYGLGLRALSTPDVPVGEDTDGAGMAAGCSIPVVTIQKGFHLGVREIASFEQEGLPLDLGGATEAAVTCARQEDRLLFRGNPKLALPGLLTTPGVSTVKVKPWNEVGAAVETVLEAVTLLDERGFHGPYGLALAPRLYNLLFRRYPQGNTTELDHMKQIITDGIVKAPVMDSGGSCCARVPS